MWNLKWCVLENVGNLKIEKVQNLRSPKYESISNVLSNPNYFWTGIDLLMNIFEISVSPNRSASLTLVGTKTDFQWWNLVKSQPKRQLLSPTAARGTHQMQTTAHIPHSWIPSVARGPFQMQSTTCIPDSWNPRLLEGHPKCERQPIFPTAGPWTYF